MIVMYPKIPTKAMIIMAKNVYRKKLTNSGGGVCFLLFLAMIFTLCAAAADFIAGALYGQFFTRQVYDMDPDPIEYVMKYSSSITAAVFAVIMFIKAACASKGRLISKEYGWTGIFMGLTFGLVHAARLVWAIRNTHGFDQYFDTGYDNDTFRGAVEIAKDGLPIVSGVLFIIAGLAVLIRLGREDFIIEAPRAEKHKASKNTAEADETAFGFGENSHNVQGLTGETKPATYGSAEEDSDSGYKETPETPEPVSYPSNTENTAKRPTVHLCPKCGELVSSDELFCSNCGCQM